MATKTMKRVMAVTKRGEKSFWVQIGVAFVNRDGSLNLKLDLVPVSADTTIQVRDFDRRDGDAAEAEAQG